MLTNETRRELLNRAKASGFPGSITDVFQAADQGIDLIEQHQMQQQQEQEMQVANTPQQQETGLREQHAQGNTQASMAFPDVQPNQSFNTVGMEAPIDIQKIDNQGHLVESYKNVPPGIQDLPTGPSEGTIIESPAAYQKGGFELPEIPVTADSTRFSRQDSLNIYDKQEELNKLAEHLNLRVQKYIPESSVSLVSRAYKKKMGDLYNDYEKKRFKYYKEYYEEGQDSKDNPFTLTQKSNAGNLIYTEGERKGEYVGYQPILNKYKPVKPKKKGTIEDVQSDEVWFEGKISKKPKKRETYTPTSLPMRNVESLPVPTNDIKLQEAGIDPSGYTHSKRYNSKKKEHEVTVREKKIINGVPSQFGHGKEVETLPLDMWKMMYKDKGESPSAYQKGGIKREKPMPMTESTHFQFPKSFIENNRRKELKDAIDLVSSKESKSTQEDMRELLTQTNYMENSMGHNSEAYNRSYTNSQASIDPIMFTDLFSPRVDEDGKSQGFTNTQKKHFQKLEDLGLPSDSINFKKELQSDNPLAATYAMRMAYGRSAEAIPSRSDSAYEDKLFKYYDEEYRKNLKVKNKTKSRKRFNDGYKSKFKKGGYRAKHIL